MTAAQFALQVAATGSGEIAAVAVPTIVVALVFIAPMAVASWWLKRRSRVAPFPREEIGDDVVAQYGSTARIDAELKRILAEGDERG